MSVQLRCAANCFNFPSSLCVQFDLLEQLGYEGYSILVNTSELQTHVMATSKGKAYHKMRQQIGKPLENPFIGYVFSEESGKSVINARHMREGYCSQFACLSVCLSVCR